ncbi:MAG TPA: TetR/AcrR family transcriptional regulator [Solirubrobacterales bacterium]|jgi:AcrR family transcriptional regulator|nr:TetR/AcrR family transcriptional regulator [Solirubrobacterales bacterium]
MTITTRPLVSRELIARYQRERFTRAIAEACLESGYSAITVADIVAAARSSRNTFYEHFSSKDAAFFALLEQAKDDLLQRVDAACAEAGTGFTERVDAALAAALEWVATETAFAKALLIDAPAGPERCFLVPWELIDGLVLRLRSILPVDASAPETTAELVVGAVTSIVKEVLVTGEPSRAPELLPSLSTFVRLPYLAEGKQSEP